MRDTADGIANNNVELILLKQGGGHVLGTEANLEMAQKLSHENGFDVWP